MAPVDGQYILRSYEMAHHGTGGLPGSCKFMGYYFDRVKLMRRQALLGPYWSLLHIVMGIWTGGNWKDQQALRRGFLDHYKHVRAAVPENRILEFRSEDGWEPICSFLQQPVPKDVPYPHVNEGVGVVQLHAFLYWIRLAKALGRMATVGAPILVAIAAIWWYLG